MTPAALADFAEVDIMLSFASGDSQMCYNITIIDDDLCEIPPENFLSHLEIVSGDFIQILFGFTEVVIIDELEPECGEYDTNINFHMVGVLTPVF